MEQANGLEIYKGISAVTADLVKAGGVGKDRKNVQQGYAFRGIDDILNVLSPLLVKHQVCILPNVISRTSEARETKNGGTLFYTTVECDFVFVSAVDGSRHVVHTFGEAMDSGDKSTNKAMSAAMKYACILGFCIPTEVEDADETEPEQLKPVAKIAPLRAPIPPDAVPNKPGVQAHNLSGGNGNGDAPKQAPEPTASANLQPVWPEPLKRVYSPSFHFKDQESRTRTQGAVVGALDEMAGDTMRRHTFLMALSGKDSIKDQSDALIKALAGWVNHPQAKSEVNRIIAEHLKAQGQTELPMERAA